MTVTDRIGVGSGQEGSAVKQAQFRVVANQGTLPQDDSDGGFLIAGNGPDMLLPPLSVP